MFSFNSGNKSSVSFFTVKTLSLCAVFVGACIYLFFLHQTHARYVSTFRDTISNSAPGEYSNHTIEFQLDTDIPAGGYVKITLGDGDFDIPTSTFDIDQAELYVAPPSLGYSLRSATNTADATYDGISVSYGSDAEVIFTLNSTAGISSGSDVRVLLGSHTTNSTTTDTGITNPSATGTQPVYIEAGGGSEAAYARALIGLVDQVGVGPVDTRETVPPLRSNGLPSGELSGLVTAAEITMETDEFSMCRYSYASGTPFYSMGNQFANTGSVYHSFVATGLLPETSYVIYVRCIDDENNFNVDDYEIAFSIKPLPEGEPGGGDDESTGGSGSGSGTGGGGSGGGSSSGGSNSSESGSGGARGGGAGGGGLDDDKPYESGDARVAISGYAFPGSRVTVLVDGTAVETGISAGSNGSFSYTIDAIARGVYTFGVFALDRDSTKSSTFTTTFSVAGARESTLSNVNLMPTIKVAPNPVDIGAQVVFSGYAIPNSTVTIETEQDKRGSPKTLTATSDSSGRWSASQSTAGFAKGTWKVRAKSVQTGGSLLSTNFSQYTSYGVGGATPALTGSNSDLNRDGKVNLVDFSILLFHWNTDGGKSDPPADINRDGKVSLTDFSIMIFNWTG